MIKVLHVISDTGIGGAGIHLLNLLRHADRTRFSYTVALPKDSLLLPRLEAIGIPTRPISRLRDRSADLAALPALLTLLQEEKPSILHTHAGFSARLAGYLLNVPVRICTKHCAYSPKGTFMHAPKARLNDLLSTHFIATAEAAADVLMAEGADAEKITVIPNGCDPVAKLTDMEKDAILKEFDIPRDAFVVGMAARMEKGKGQEVLIEAAAHCLAETPRLFFLFVGGGSMENAYKEIATKLGIARNVYFTGFRADVGRVMNLFDLNLNCSYLSETASFSLSEGMSLGIVPVVSDIGGNPFMAGYGENGAVVRAHDPEALARVLLALYRAPKARAALAARAMARYEVDFRAADMTRKTEELYLRALHRARAETTTKTPIFH